MIRQAIYAFSAAALSSCAPVHGDAIAWSTGIACFAASESAAQDDPTTFTAGEPIWAFVTLQQCAEGVQGLTTYCEFGFREGILELNAGADWYVPGSKRDWPDECTRIHTSCKSPELWSDVEIEYGAAQRTLKIPSTWDASPCVGIEQ